MTAHGRAGPAPLDQQEPAAGLEPIPVARQAGRLSPALGGPAVTLRQALRRLLRRWGNLGVAGRPVPRAGSASAPGSVAPGRWPGAAAPSWASAAGKRRTPPAAGRSTTAPPELAETGRQACAIASRIRRRTSRRGGLIHVTASPDARWPCAVPPRRCTRPGWLKQEAQERLASAFPSGLRLQVSTAPSHARSFPVRPGQGPSHRSRPLGSGASTLGQRGALSITPEAQGPEGKMPAEAAPRRASRPWKYEGLFTQVCGRCGPSRPARHPGPVPRLAVAGSRPRCARLTGRRWRPSRRLLCPPELQ